jgi:hypothetical protein
MVHGLIMRTRHAHDSDQASGLAATAGSGRPNGKPMTLRKSVAFVLVAALGAGCGTDGAAPGSSMVVELPPGVAVGDRTSFSCRALMESELTGSDGSVIKEGLEGKITSGTNDVSVSLEDARTMRLLSQAGFAAGTTVGPAFSVTEDSTDHLVATYIDGQSMNSFVLNKLNGLAIWAKTRPTFPGYRAPTGSQTYLTCR